MSSECSSLAQTESFQVPESVLVQEEVPLHPSCVYHGIPECQSLGELRYHLSQHLQSEDFLTLSRTATPQLGREEIKTEMTMDLRKEPIGRW